MDQGLSEMATLPRWRGIKSLLLDTPLLKMYFEEEQRSGMGAGGGMWDQEASKKACETPTQGVETVQRPWGRKQTSCV